MVLRPRRHPCETVHGQRRRAPGREADAAAARHAGRVTATRLPRQRRRGRDCSRSFCEAPEEQVHTALWEARRQQLIEHSIVPTSFVHDRVHEAAYALIPEAERAEAHLRIGRLLAEHTPPEKRDEAIFDIVNHLNRGAGADHVTRGTGTPGRVQPDRGEARQGFYGLCLRTARI